jgi:hypothetical protein
MDTLFIRATIMAKTFLLVHGAWVTTDSWTGFRDFIEAQGHEVVVPPWPYMEGSVEALRHSPDSRLSSLTTAWTPDIDRAFLWRIDRSNAA